MTKDKAHEGYIVEFIAVGKSMKATAIDPQTLVEASVIAPTKTPRRELAKLAVRKLEYVLGKDKKN